MPKKDGEQINSVEFLSIIFFVIMCSIGYIYFFSDKDENNLDNFYNIYNANNKINKVNTDRKPVEQVSKKITKNEFTFIKQRMQNDMQRYNEYHYHTGQEEVEQIFDSYILQYFLLFAISLLGLIFIYNIFTLMNEYDLKAYLYFVAENHFFHFLSKKITDSNGILLLKSILLFVIYIIFYIFMHVTLESLCFLKYIILNNQKYIQCNKWIIWKKFVFHPIFLQGNYKFIFILSLLIVFLFCLLSYFHINLVKKTQEDFLIARI